MKLLPPSSTLDAPIRGQDNEEKMKTQVNLDMTIDRQSDHSTKEISSSEIRSSRRHRTKGSLPQGRSMVNIHLLTILYN